MARIRKVVCDWCKKECEGDRFVVFIEDADGMPKGTSDYCEECWNKMHTYPKRQENSTQ